MKYYTIHEMTEILGVTAQTLRNWDKSGKLKLHHTSSNSYRYYSEDDFNQFLNKPINKQGKPVGYCRVSSPKQKDDLERQKENRRTYLFAQGKPFEIVDTTEQTELVEDLVQIITVFSYKLQGERANKAKKMIKELTEND